MSKANFKGGSFWKRLHHLAREIRICFLFKATGMRTHASTACEICLQLSGCTVSRGF